MNFLTVFIQYKSKYIFVFKKFFKINKNGIKILLFWKFYHDKNSEEFNN